MAPRNHVGSRFTITNYPAAYLPEHNPPGHRARVLETITHELSPLGIEDTTIIWKRKVTGIQFSRNLARELPPYLS